MSKFQIDPSHSSAQFTIKHMMIAKVHGGFQKMSGSLELDPSQIEKASIEVNIEANSIQTHEAQRDAHLKSPDFFDVEKYPLITFKSTRVDGTIGSLKVTGDLTIHGVTKSIILEVDGPSNEMKDPWGNTKIGASATAKINRRDFGLSWNAALEAGGFLVGEEVTIQLEVQFVKQNS